MSGLIFALASAKGRAGVAVLRISGPNAVNFISQFVGLDLPKAGRSLRNFVYSEAVIDQVLVLTFEKDKSFTGEEVVEIHCHGSTAVVNRILEILSNQPEACLAEAGEFTRRALINGCLDLVQVEGLADLIDAETESQRILAARVMQGQFSDKVHLWRRNLVRAASLIEATIDFADEDVPTDVVPEVIQLLDVVMADLDKEIGGVQAAERIRDGFEVAILGKPNVGKSTLLNKLAGRKAAITSQIAGTTRDIIEVRMDIEGYAVTLLDTAGLRDTSDEIEALGVDLARERAVSADIRVFLTNDGKIDDLGVKYVDGDIVASSKADVSRETTGFQISAKTGLGVDQLIKNIAELLSKRAMPAQTATNQRHKAGMQNSLNSLVKAYAFVVQGSDVAEMAAAELRNSLTELGILIGVVDVEDLLDEIFSSFCIGK